MISELAERRVDQVDIAKAAGVTKGAVTQWLNGGIKSIKMPYALGIERTYGYNHRWLVMGEEPKMAADRNKEGGESTSTSPWPFKQISAELVTALSHDDLIRLEAAIIFAANQVGVKVTTPKDKSKSKAA